MATFLPLKRSRQTVALLLASTLALAACSSADEPEATPTPEPITQTPTPSPTPSPEPEPAITWPLNGMEVPQDQLEEWEQIPAVGVKIENSAAARPQTGLNQADVVWVEMVEGGTTRFLATYHSQHPELVGPIRSIRPMDAAIAGGTGGVLAYSGGLHPYTEAAQQAGLVTRSFDFGHTGFWRDHSRRAPHNVYGDVTVLAAAAKDDATAPPAWNFAATAAEATAHSGESASQVIAQYPRVQSVWEWQSDDELWLRSDDGAAAVEANGDRISADNVIILRVRVEMTGRRDGSGARVPETILEGDGEAIYLGGGATTTGIWRKGGAAETIELLDAEGEPVLLAPGRTWVELVPTSSGASVSINQ